MLKAAVLTSTLLVSQAIMVAQSQPERSTAFSPVVKGMVLSDVECSPIHSRFTDHDYNVYVSLPAGYQKGGRHYPGLYVPDSVELFQILRAMGMAMRSVGVGEELILVGIPLKSEDTEDWLRKRAFDFTPTESTEENASLGIAWHGEVRSGGAPLFLRTLKEELIQYIEANYRVTSDRGLAGYSLGGLFVAYVLLSGDDTFSRYLIGSRSLWWDNGAILKTEAAAARSGKALRGRAFLSVGGDEDKGPNTWPTQVGVLANLAATLTSRADPALRVESHIFESTDHLSGIAGSLSRGLKVLYAGPQPQP